MTTAPKVEIKNWTMMRIEVDVRDRINDLKDEKESQSEYLTRLMDADQKRKN